MESSTGDIQQVLSIDQIRSIRANNDYVERPTVSYKQTLSNPSISQVAKEDCPNVQLVSFTQPDLHRSQSQQHQSQNVTHDLSHSSTISSVSRSTTASDQRLLTGITPSNSGHSLMRTQPKDGDLKQDQFIKGLVEKPGRYRGHHFICEECGRCKCNECKQVQKLPSCWICDKRCLCSAENVIDYGTCLCCVQCLFYHCSSDEEDNCADNPCSCSQGQGCCTRWAVMGVLSLFMPCLCCYPPLKGCLTICQKSYDRVKRPGCRCKNHTNTVCRKISSSSGTPFPRPLDKPV